jgi:hypothetical protein
MNDRADFVNGTPKAALDNIIKILPRQNYSFVGETKGFRIWGKFVLLSSYRHINSENPD